MALSSQIPIEEFKYHFDESLLPPKVESQGKKWDLTKIKERHEYFKHKLGKKLPKLQQIFSEQTFIVYMLAPKLAGKGTYLSILRELVGNTFYQLSVGDLVREFQKEYPKNPEKYAGLRELYRGFVSFEDAVEAMLDPSITNVKSTEFVLALIKLKIQQIGRKIIFLDGFPRTEDQIMYSLFMRDLMAFRDDPDFFMMINIPITIIDMRIRYRRVCPKCGSSRNIKLLPTDQLAWDKEKNEVILLCDTPECNRQPMVPKPGDEVGVQALLPRLKRDFKLLEIARTLHGVDRIELFNAIPVDVAPKYYEPYELTPIYDYEYKNGKVIVKTSPWVVEEAGNKYYSLLPAPALLQFVDQFLKLFA